VIRSMWLIVSTIAVANLLALAGFVGWLAASDRLDFDRIEQVRELIAPTRSEEMARARALEAEEAAAKARLEEQGDLGALPINAADRLSVLREVDEVSRQRFERMERETRDLQRQLRAELESIATERENFETMRTAFERRRQEIEELEGSRQFKRAMQLYEGSRPEATANMFQTLIQQGREEDVVSYLNAMKPMSARRVIAEFEGRDPALAARLLEGVRTYGLAPDR